MYGSCLVEMSMHLKKLEFVSHLIIFALLSSRLFLLYQADVLWYPFQVHDFGFFSYDPSAVQFLSYEEIPLAPEAASVGLEIRVVGNDSGEKVTYKYYGRFLCILNRIFQF